MANTYKLEVLSPEGNIFSGDVISATFPTKSGIITVLAGHTALITVLSEGNIEILLDNGENKVITVVGGFLEISDNLVNTMADFAVRTDEIDDEMIRKAKEYAEEQKKRKDLVNSEMAENDLKQAILALKVLENNKLKRKNKGAKY